MHGSTNALKSLSTALKPRMVLLIWSRSTLERKSIWTSNMLNWLKSSTQGRWKAISRRSKGTHIGIKLCKNNKKVAWVLRDYHLWDIDLKPWIISCPRSALRWSSNQLRTGTQASITLAMKTNPWAVCVSTQLRFSKLPNLSKQWCHLGWARPRVRCELDSELCTTCRRISLTKWRASRCCLRPDRKLSIIRPSRESTHRYARPKSRICPCMTTFWQTLNPWITPTRGWKKNRGTKTPKTRDSWGSKWNRNKSKISICRKKNGPISSNGIQLPQLRP